MYGIGLWEILILLIILVIIVGPILLSLFLRKKYPRKMWVGIVLSFFFAPFGQLYLEGGAVYIIALIVIIAVALQYGTGYFFLSNIVSAIIMYYRMRKVIVA